MNEYRVVCTDNPNVSPFPSHVWPTREQAQRFCDSKDAKQWQGKLTVVLPAGAPGKEG